MTAARRQAQTPYPGFFWRGYGPNNLRTRPRRTVAGTTLLVAGVTAVITLLA